MSANSADKITDTRNAARPNSARVTSPRSSGGNSLSCDNLAGWPTVSKVHFVTYQIDSSSNPIAGTQLDCYAIVSGNNLTSFTVVDGNDKGNSVGDVVEMLPTAAWAHDLFTALTAQHSQLDGSHHDVTTNTLVVSSGTTLPAEDIGTADLASGAVTPEKLTSGAGTTWVWQSWTPTWANLTVGNGVVTARYTQIGKKVSFYLTLVAGTTTSVSGTVTFTLPVASRDTGSVRMPIGVLEIEDDGVSNYLGTLLVNGSGPTVAQPMIYTTAAAYAGWQQLSSTVPYNSFANLDSLQCSATYEVN